MSAAPAILAQALVDDLDEHLGDDVAVHRGRPGSLPQHFYKLVYMHAPRNWRLGAGEQHRIETFDFAFAVETYAPGEDSAATADDARWDIVWAIHERLKKTDLAGYETKGKPLTMVECGLTPYDKGWVAHSILTVGMERRVN